MPNHVSNELVVSGPMADVVAFAKRSTNGYFVVAGNPDDAQARMLALGTPGERYEGLFSFGALTGIPEDFASNWYDWSCQNWGTKWDAYNVTLNGEADSPGALVDAVTADAAGNGVLSLEFTTAWSPPSEWLAAATEMFPTLLFRMIFTDEMPNFVGVARATDGEVTFIEYEHPGELVAYPEGGFEDEEYDEKVNEWWTAVQDALWDQVN